MQICSSHSVPFGSSLIELNKDQCTFYKEEEENEKLRQKRKSEWIKLDELENEFIQEKRSKY